MKKISLYTTLALVLALMLAGSAGAAIVEVPDPGPTYWDSTAQAIAASARNGAPGDFDNPVGTYAIGLGLTDLSTSPPTGLLRLAILPDSNPDPRQFWTFNSSYHFKLVYEYFDGAGYVTRFEIAGLFNENTTPYTASLQAGLPEYAGIYTIRLNYAGSTDPLGGQVQISNLTLGGATMGAGAYNSGGSNNSVYFRNSDGAPFTRNFTIEGDFVFTGAGGAANYPGFEIDLSPQPVVPLPPSVLLLGSGLLGLAWRKYRKS